MRSIKEECLDRLIPIGERHFRRAVVEYVEHYHRERNHQGIANRLISGPVGDPDDRSRATAFAARRTPQLLHASGVNVRSAEKWNITGLSLTPVWDNPGTCDAFDFVNCLKSMA